MKGITSLLAVSMAALGVAQVPVRTSIGSTRLPGQTFGSTRRSPLPAGMAKPAPLGIHSIRRIKATPQVLAQYSAAISNKTHYDAPGRGSNSTAFQARVTSTSVLVLYDGAGIYGFVGNVYARQLASLIQATGRPVDIAAVESYTSGKMNAYAQTFYLGVEYDNQLPAAFKTDVLNSTKPVCWSGYNLWQIAWTPDWTADNATFTKKFGIRFNQVDSRNFVNISYKGKTLDADSYGSGLGSVTITNANKAVSLADANTKAGKTIPYMVHGGNLWYIADNPLEDGSAWVTIPRTFAFMDVLHDIVADGVVEDHPAVLRIEDVHAEADPQMLRDIADFLYSAGVPYVVCVIPHYRDPLGYWNYGTPVDETINDKPQLVAALQYMQAHGGEIIMHGDTHQYDDVANSGSGVSGDDFEFFRMVKDDTGNEQMWGPVWEDSAAWVNGRLDEGFSILSQAGLGHPTGWNTPHYLASPTDYQVFQQRFNYSFCRGKTFSVDAAGYLYLLEQEPGFPIVDDFGMYRFPETLGYVSTPDLGVLHALPQNMVNRSKKVLALRNGWAGCFFHWFLPVSMLQDLVNGVKNQGFHFVSPKDYYNTHVTGH